MVDVRDYVQSNSKSLTADDLIGGPMTIRIVRVSTRQPVGDDRRQLEIFYDRGGDRPWSPSLTMGKVLQSLFGWDSTAWVGKRITLFRDETVVFGSSIAPGIRISHADIDKPKKILVMEKRKKHQIITIDPLPVGADWLKLSRDAAENGMNGYKIFFQSLSPEAKAVIGSEEHEKNKTRADEVDKARSPPIDEIGSGETVSQ